MDKITVSTIVNASAARAWTAYTSPEDIVHWNFASDDWHCPDAMSDLSKGGKFSYRMEAKDGSFGFDFAGTFTLVDPERRLDYEFGDRQATVTFAAKSTGTEVSVSFDPETENPLDLQRNGWQSILDNFKRHVER